MQKEMTAEEVRQYTRNQWTEAEFQNAVIGEARFHRWVVAHFRKVRVQRKNGSVYWETPVQADGAGFPDLILSRANVMLAVELKVGRNDTSADQALWLARFRAAGIIAFVWRPNDWNEIVARLA